MTKAITRGDPASMRSESRKASRPVETEFFFVLQFPDFTRENFLALWLAPLLCVAVSLVLFWWGLS